MDKRKAERLGRLLRSKRQAAGLSTHSLSRASGVGQPMIVRIERGQMANPDRTKLDLLAKALDIDLADVMAEAGYPVVTEELQPTTYLRAKFRDLPTESLDALQRDVARVLRRHGIDPGSRPPTGEDERPEGSRRKKPIKKGGTT